MIGEIHSDRYCLHPYYGFVCTPGAVIDFSETVPAHFGHAAAAHIDAEGFRNGTKSVEKLDGEFWIGLFGGSAAFSTAATHNGATVAGQLERKLQQSGFSRRVQVRDFTVPGGQQPQQLLISLLNLQRLDGVVTFDGVNEVVIPGFYNWPAVAASFPYRPVYEALYGRGITDEQIGLSWLRRDKNERFDRRPNWMKALTRTRHDAEIDELTCRLRATDDSIKFRSLFPVPEPSAAAAVDAGARLWQTATERMFQLCQANGLRSLFTVQPIPDREKALTEYERTYLVPHGDVLAIRSAGYSRVLERAEALRQRSLPVVPLTDVFKDYSGDVYTDLIHFEDRGCEIVAERIARHIIERWR